LPAQYSEFCRIVRCQRIQRTGARRILNHDPEIGFHISERTTKPDVLLPHLMENEMMKLGMLGASALVVALAVATPVSAEMGHGGGGRMGGGGMGGMHAGPAGGTNIGGGSGGFRGAQASMGGGQVGGGQGWAGRSGGGQFAQGGYQGGSRGYRGGWRGERGGYGRGVGFGVGAALGYGAYGGYGDSYYGDDYAYDDSYDGGYYPSGYTIAGGSDPGYCAQRYRSYDPASGTYVGYDGLRHPCGE
jgi:hypothetical protein